MSLCDTSVVEAGVGKASFVPGFVDAPATCFLSGRAVLTAGLDPR